jgi:uncharacterized protein YgiM (DUF1202 family)
MNKYILIAFAVMAMAFYELSGGADFKPGETSLVIFAEPKPYVAEPKKPAELVARADTASSTLTDIAPARAVIAPVATNIVPVVTPAALETEVELAASGDVIVLSEQAAPLIQEVATAPATQPDLRFVDGDRVNVRGGPGTEFAVVGKLFRNDMVEIINDEGNGWLHLRDTVTGDEGWIADWLVTAAN